MAENFDWANYDWGQGTPGLMARPKNDALSMGLLAAGLGILANNRGNYGQLGPALGAGGLAGLSTYQNMLQQDRQSRLDDSRLTMEQQRQKMMEAQMLQGAQTLKMLQDQAKRKTALDEEKMRGLQRIREAWQSAVNGGGSGQLAQGAAEGDIGPTKTNAERSSGNPMDLLTPEQRFIVNKHVEAEDFTGALKTINEYLKPIVAGDKIQEIRNGKVRPVPGAVATHGEFVNEGERVRAAWEPFMNLLNAQNQAIPITRAGFVDRFGTKAASQQAEPTGLDGLSPSIANAIKNDMMRSGVQSANFRIGPTDAAAGTPVSPANIRTGQINIGQTSRGGMPSVSGPTIEQKEVAPKVAAALAQELNTQFTKRLFEGYDSATKGLESLRTIEESRQAIAGGAYLGSGANLKLDTLKAVDSVFGLRIDSAKMANTDTLISTLGESMTDRVKELGVNPTNEDRRIIEKIVGTIGKDPKALEKMLDWQEEVIRRGIESHNKRATQAIEGGSKFMFPLTVDLPERKSAQTQNAPMKYKKFNPATGRIE